MSDGREALWSEMALSARAEIWEEWRREIDVEDVGMGMEVS